LAAPPLLVAQFLLVAFQVPLAPPQKEPPMALPATPKANKKPRPHGARE
jgi:hypothetical protein